MDISSLMCYLNKYEVRHCYNCGEAYNVSDFQGYLKNHQCKSPFKKKAYMKIKKMSKKPKKYKIDTETVYQLEVDN